MARKNLGEWIQQSMLAVELVAEEWPEFKKNIMVKAMQAVQLNQLAYLELPFMRVGDVEHYLGESGKVMAAALLRRAREEERALREEGGFVCSCARTFAFEQHRDSHQKMHEREKDRTECYIVQSVFGDQPREERAQPKQRKSKSKDVAAGGEDNNEEDGADNRDEEEDGDKKDNNEEDGADNTDEEEDGDKKASGDETKLGQKKKGKGKEVNPQSIVKVEEKTPDEADARVEKKAKKPKANAVTATSTVEKKNEKDPVEKKTENELREAKKTDPGANIIKSMDRPASEDGREGELSFYVNRRRGGPLVEGLNVSSEGYIKKIWSNDKIEKFFHGKGLKTGQKVAAFVVSKPDLEQGKTRIMGTPSAEISMFLQQTARSTHRVEPQEGGRVKFGEFASQLEAVLGRVRVVVTQLANDVEVTNDGVANDVGVANDGATNDGVANDEGVVAKDSIYKGKVPLLERQCKICKFVFTCQPKALKGVMRIHMTRKHGVNRTSPGEGAEKGGELSPEVAADGPETNSTACYLCQESVLLGDDYKAHWVAVHMIVGPPNMGPEKSPRDEMGVKAPSKKIKLNHVKNPLNPQTPIHSTPPGTNNPLEPSPRKSSGEKVDENQDPETDIIVTYQRKNPENQVERKSSGEKKSRKSSGEKVDENQDPETDIIVTYQRKNPALEARIKVLVEKVDQGWRCGECGMENKHKFRLRRHVQIHLNGISHPCPNWSCGKKYNTENALDHHMHRVHR